MLKPAPLPDISIFCIVISEIVMFVAKPLIVINRSPAPSDIALPSNMVKSLPAPIIVILDFVMVILSSVIPVPQVPAPTFIVPPQVGTCSKA